MAHPHTQGSDDFKVRSRLYSTEYFSFSETESSRSGHPIPMSEPTCTAKKKFFLASNHNFLCLSKVLSVQLKIRV